MIIMAQTKLCFFHRHQYLLHDIRFVINWTLWRQNILINKMSLFLSSSFLCWTKIEGKKIDCKECDISTFKWRKQTNWRWFFFLLFANEYYFIFISLFFCSFACCLSIRFHTIRELLHEFKIRYVPLFASKQRNRISLDRWIVQNRTAEVKHSNKFASLVSFHKPIW